MNRNMKLAVIFIVFSFFLFIVGYLFRNTGENIAIIVWFTALLFQLLGFIFVYRFIYNK